MTDHPANHLGNFGDRVWGESVIGGTRAPSRGPRDGDPHISVGSGAYLVTVDTATLHRGRYGS